LQYGVPQGSVLGPRIFTEYAEDVSDILALRHHLFADDMQGYCSGRLGDVHVMASRIERCVSDVSDWCAAKRLLLNADKTEVLWFGPPSQLRQLSSVSSAITVNRNVIKLSSVVRDLGVLFDIELSMRQHVSRVTRTSAPARLACVTDVCASTSRVCHGRLRQHVSRVSQTSAPARLACVTDVCASTSRVCHGRLRQHVSRVSRTSAAARLACVTDVCASTSRVCHIRLRQHVSRVSLTCFFHLLSSYAQSVINSVATSLPTWLQL